MLKNLPKGVPPGRDRPKWLRSAPLALIIFVLCSPFAMGETKIQEVQPWPTDEPTQLIVYGTEFGTIFRGAAIDGSQDTPQIHFGTQMESLRIATLQTLCDTPLGGVAPPLELNDRSDR